MEPRSAVKREIEGDSLLVAALADRIFEKSISRRGPMATPEAFDAEGEILPCVSIFGGDGTSEQGVISGLFQGVVTCWYRVPESDGNRVLLDELVHRTIDLLNDRVIPLGEDPEISGPGCVVELIDRFGSTVDPFVERTMFAYVRFRTLEVL